MKKLYSTAEVSRQAMIAPYRLVYALARGRIKEPRRLNGRRCWSERGVEEVKEYFSKGNIYKESRKNPFRRTNA